MHARVLGLLEGVSVVAVGLGSLLAPLLLSLAGLRASLVVAGLLLALLAPLSRGALNKDGTDGAAPLAPAPVPG